VAIVIYVTFLLSFTCAHCFDTRNFSKNKLFPSTTHRKGLCKEPLTEAVIFKQNVFENHRGGLYCRLLLYCDYYIKIWNIHEIVFINESITPPFSSNVAIS